MSLQIDNALPLTSSLSPSTPPSLPSLSPLYLGGLPPGMRGVSKAGEVGGFVGCIRHLQVGVVPSVFHMFFVKKLRILIVEGEKKELRFVLRSSEITSCYYYMYYALLYHIRVRDRFSVVLSLVHRTYWYIKVCFCCRCQVRRGWCSRMLCLVGI